MHARIARLASVAALSAVLIGPAVTSAADPTPAAPPADVQAWQVHLAMMRSMGRDFGAHVTECVELHGSLDGQLRPNDSMVDLMTTMMGGPR